MFSFCSILSVTDTVIFLANSFICDTNTFEYFCGKNTIGPITAYLIENGVGQNFEYKIVETILLPKTAYVLVYLNNNKDTAHVFDFVLEEASNMWKCTAVSDIRDRFPA